MKGNMRKEIGRFTGHPGWTASRLTCHREPEGLLGGALRVRTNLKHYLKIILTSSLVQHVKSLEVIPPVLTTRKWTNWKSTTLVSIKQLRLQGKLQLPTLVLLTGSKTQEQAAGVSTGEKETGALEEIVASDTYSYSKQKTQPTSNLTLKTYLPQFLLPDISNTTFNKNYKAY